MLQSENSPLHTAQPDCRMMDVQRGTAEDFQSSSADKDVTSSSCALRKSLALSTRGQTPARALIDVISCNNVKTSGFTLSYSDSRSRYRFDTAADTVKQIIDCPLYHLRTTIQLQRSKHCWVESYDPPLVHRIQVQQVSSAPIYRLPSSAEALQSSP